MSKDIRLQKPASQKCRWKAMAKQAYRHDLMKLEWADSVLRGYWNKSQCRK